MYNWFIISEGVITRSISEEAIKLLKSDEKITIFGPAIIFLIFPFLLSEIACFNVVTPESTSKVG